MFFSVPPLRHLWPTLILSYCLRAVYRLIHQQVLACKGDMPSTKRRETGLPAVLSMPRRGVTNLQCSFLDVDRRVRTPCAWNASQAAPTQPGKDNQTSNSKSDPSWESRLKIRAPCPIVYSLPPYNKKGEPLTKIESLVIIGTMGKYVKEYDEKWKGK
jgi:hypothetical protein